MMPELPITREDRKYRPTIIELVGPAGAGKSTVAGVLQEQHERIVVERGPYFRRVRDIPFFCGNTLLSLPILIRLYLNRKQCGGLTLREVAQMVILRGWCGMLRRQASAHDLTIVLEQGPVNMLAGLWNFGSDIFRSQCTKMWWDCTCKQWADTLDLLVRLDTSVPTLVERVRTRNKWHIIKELPDQAAFDRLSRHQIALDDVIPRLSATCDGPRVLDFDTGQMLPDQISNEIMAVLWQ